MTRGCLPDHDSTHLLVPGAKEAAAKGPATGLHCPPTSFARAERFTELLQNSPIHRAQRFALSGRPNTGTPCRMHNRMPRISSGTQATPTTPRPPGSIFLNRLERFASIQI